MLKKNEEQFLRIGFLYFLDFHETNFNKLGEMVRNWRSDPEKVNDPHETNKFTTETVNLYLHNHMRGDSFS